MQCPACGAEGSGQFCVTCGAQLPASDPAPPPMPSEPSAEASPQTPSAPVQAPAQAAGLPQQPTPATAPKKKGWCLKGCLVAIVIPILMVIVALGWLGFMPGLSKLIGPKPRDLGVEMTVPAAWEGAQALNVPDTQADVKQMIDDPASVETFDGTVTSEQATSLLGLGQADIPNWPFEFVQIRFNGDGTAEAAGILDFEEFNTFLVSNLGVPEGDAAEAISKVMFVSDTTFYIHGTGSVTNNQASMSVSELQIGRFTVPAGWYQGKEHHGTQYISSALDREGFAIEHLGHDANGMTARGRRPASSLMPWIDIVRDDRVEGIVP